jgi:TPR repeat protein
MTANRVKWFLLLSVIGAGFQSPAQQSEADRKLLADIRATAESGDAQSQLQLGHAFRFGRLGVAKDGEEAVKWYRKAAEKGDAGAQSNLGFCYHAGNGVTKDEVEAVRWYRKAAEQGDAMAQNNLGVCYDIGNGVTKDEVEAVKWDRRAAEQGDAMAQNSLGVCYDTGSGVTKDAVEAVKWYRKAAEGRLADAQFHFGVCYLTGNGVTKDAVKAVKWFRKAAEQGDAKAQSNLGFCYHEGNGVTKDAVEGVKWFRKSAEQGNADAQHNLGYCYRMGNGVAKDAVEAMRWFRKAAERNDAAAQYKMGFHYANGEGVAKDYVEANKWYNLASAQGYEHAKTALLAIERVMPPSQIAEAQRLAREFSPRTAPRPGGFDSRIADSRPVGSGTGFFITEDGFLVTSAHVLKEATQVRLVSSSGFIAARVVKCDTFNDLGLLKVEGKSTLLSVVSSRAVKMGSTVATVGFPNIGLQGFAPKLAKGEIAALSGAQDDPRYFQISVPIQPGNSGGALVDERGNVVGVVSAKLSAAAAVTTSGALPENVNYAVKSTLLLSFLE